LSLSAFAAQGALVAPLLFPGKECMPQEARLLEMAGISGAFPPFVALCGDLVLSMLEMGHE